MLRDTLLQLIDDQPMNMRQAEDAMRLIMSGGASDAEIGAFLIAMRIRGAMPEQIEGFARCMRDACIPIRARSHDLVDTVGTGGDALNTFNISTAAAIVAAGAEVKMAKHGNRAVSSQSGSADVLAELGVNINMAPEEVADCIDTCGIGFLFAQRLHPAMKHAAGPRQALGIRTVFNVLGPLTNPAGASRQVLGVYAPELTETLAQTLMRLGSVHALVVYGMDGLDEFSTIGETLVSELYDSQVTTYSVTPEQFGLKRATANDIAGSTPADNAQMLCALLAGKQGPRRDIVLLNAAASIYVGGKASTIGEGLELAASSIDSGAAQRVLRDLRAHTPAGQTERA